MIVNLYSRLWISLLACSAVLGAAIQGKSVVKRFIADTMATSMFEDLLSQSLTSEFDKQCIKCKCHSECDIDEHIVELICQQKEIDCPVPSQKTETPSPVTTLPSPSTSSPSPSTPSPSPSTIASSSSSTESSSVTTESLLRTTTSPKHVTSTPQTDGTVETIPVCDKFCTVGSVARKVSISNPNGTQCDESGSYASPESFTTVCCQLNDRSSWAKGPKVMDDCSGLSHYTPVAKFFFGFPIKGSAGVFVTCLQGDETGFQFVQQECDAAPDMVHVSNQGSSHFQDPESYYVILS